MVKIKITINSIYDNTHPQAQKLQQFLITQGFHIDDHKEKWLAISYEGEGEIIKNALRKEGFADYEFQIKVEYQRQWGFL